jgi:hypothetical protein
MKRLLKTTLLFATFAFPLYIGGAIIWGAFVEGHVYNCTDSMGMGFFIPGDWVHFDHGHLGYGDTIAPGWSWSLIWLLWLGFYAAILVGSILLTRLALPYTNRVVRGFPVVDQTPAQSASAGQNQTPAT